MKILTIIGARPQFIKAAVLSHALKDRSDIEEIIVHTGQHFDQNMSQIFFDDMQIPKPKYNLQINGGGHGEMTGQMLIEIEKVVKREQPDWLLVYGDTNSTLAGALVASKLHIKLVHVEAGLRSFNMKMPEEINRILTDRVSNILFCSTEAAIRNLYNEGIKDSLDFEREIHNVGDIMEESFNMFSTKNSCIVDDSDYVLATLHRAENTDNPEKLKGFINELNKINETIKVVLPLHPRTKKAIADQGLTLKCEVIDPVGYLDMVPLIKNSTLVITDSGGLQKEAYFARKFCITMREQTEWVELLEHKINFLVSHKDGALSSKFQELKDVAFPTDIKELYGDGKVAEKIISGIKEYKYY